MHTVWKDNIWYLAKESPQKFMIFDTCAVSCFLHFHYNIFLGVFLRECTFFFMKGNRLNKKVMATSLFEETILAWVSKTWRVGNDSTALCILLIICLDITALLHKKMYVWIKHENQVEVLNPWILLVKTQVKGPHFQLRTIYKRALIQYPLRSRRMLMPETWYNALLLSTDGMCIQGIEQYFI